MPKKSSVNLTPVIATVRNILTQHPPTRDSDVKLCALIWWNERQEKEDTKEFLNLMYHGGLTSPEAITRVRRKLQEKHPELRGASYVERQRKQKKVKEEIKLNTNWR